MAGVAKIASKTTTCAKRFVIDSPNLLLCHTTETQDLFDIVFDLAAALQSEGFVNHLAVAIDVESFRQELHATVSITYRFFADENRVIHTHIFGEGSNVARAGVIHGDTNKL